ncbi:hypothetical protein K492DRAFT_189508 [Lichtheimia hyalospora FSU 10163]|nr:hypothetical protein K492DRAFT_189508 [Lichtheimia hyalospora FSU 10163]
MRLEILALVLLCLTFAHGDENRLASPPLPRSSSSITPAPTTWFQVEPVANLYLKRQQEPSLAIPTSSVKLQDDDDDDDQTVVLNVTTVVVAASDNMTETTLKDANDSSSVIADQLEDNQNALHDMTLVVVLVCSISGTAVVICAIIFAWFRIRKYKRQQQTKKTHHHHKHHSPCSSMPCSPSLSPKAPFSNDNDQFTTKPEEGDGVTTAISGEHNHDRLSSSDESTIIIPPHNVGSTSAQPAPSAPTEKELGDSSPLQLPHPSIYIHGSDSLSSSSVSLQQQQQEVYQHYDTVPPPPAYTPTAPSSTTTPSLLMMGHPATSVSSSLERISLPITTSAAPAAPVSGFTDSPLPYRDRNS